MFVANWKTYKTNVSEVNEFFKELPIYSASFKQGIEIVLCPSTIHLEAVSTMKPSNVILGAQDCSQYGSGPYTGETTAGQLSTVGVKYCIVGHVYKRKYGETDQMINNKIKQCLASGIAPIVCFGETLQEYDADQTRIILERQMRDCLIGIKDLQNVILCYMPMWSIGTGFYTTGEYSNIIADFMRKTAVKLTGNPMSANCTILFGGQITSGNCKEYLETPEVDGVMFSIPALKPKDFADVINVDFDIKKYLKVCHAPVSKEELQKASDGKLNADNDSSANLG